MSEAAHKVADFPASEFVVPISTSCARLAPSILYIQMY